MDEKFNFDEHFENSEEHVYMDEHMFKTVEKMHELLESEMEKNEYSILQILQIVNEVQREILCGLTHIDEEENDNFDLN